MRYCTSNQLLRGCWSTDHTVRNKRLRKLRSSQTLGVQKNSLRNFLQVQSPKLYAQRISGGSKTSAFETVLLILRASADYSLRKKRWGCAGFNLGQGIRPMCHSWVYHLLSLWSEISNLTSFRHSAQDYKMSFVLSALSVSVYCCEVAMSSCMFTSYTNVSCLTTLCNHVQSFDTEMSPPSSWCSASPAFLSFEIFREDHSNVFWGSPGASPGSLRCWETGQSIYLGESGREMCFACVRVGYQSAQEQLQVQIWIYKALVS